MKKVGSGRVRVFIEGAYLFVRTVMCAVCTKKSSFSES